MTPKELAEERKRIILETSKAYTLNTRGTTPEGSCCYSKGCAVGRLLTQDEKDEIVEARNDMAPLSDIFWSLPERVSVLGEEFLTDLQDLHDVKDNWDDQGLSQAGQRYLKRLLELWGEPQ